MALRTALTSLLLGATFCIASFGTASAASVECAQPDGLHPVVATADAAKDIYQAVAVGRGDKIKDNIVVKDSGPYWNVFQYTPPFESKDANGQVAITLVSGGGTLMMQIDKCEGTIDAHYSQ
jgi:hypothetical protein